MLSSLSIRNVVLINQLEVEFKNGFCALTGETGAGKSILLGALGLAIGHRAAARLVSYGEKKASVTAKFILEENHPALLLAIDKGIGIESRELILRRELSSDGKSRAFINDQSITIGLLSEIGELLVEINGQNDRIGLLDYENHRQILDSFAQNKKLNDEVFYIYKEWTDAKKLYSEQMQINKEAEFLELSLKDQLSELSELSPIYNEERNLENKRKFMMQTEKISSALKALENIYLINNSSLMSNFSNVSKNISLLGAQSGGRLDNLISSLERLEIELSEVWNEFESISSQIEYNQSELENIESRLFALRAASRRYKVDVNELNNIKDEIILKIEGLNKNNKNLEILFNRKTEIREKYINASKKLSKKRLDAGKVLDANLHKEFPQLKLHNVKFFTSLEQLDESNWNENGMENVKFLVSTNNNLSYEPLYKIASGGELSRLMLSLRAVLSVFAPQKTLVFDEIDAGIDGTTSDSVGKRLAILGVNQQILAVTHQAQVAAHANFQWQVSKYSNNGKSNTEVIELLEDERKEAIAKMLAGHKVTVEARGAANKLIELVKNKNGGENLD